MPLPRMIRLLRRLTFSHKRMPVPAALPGQAGGFGDAAIPVEIAGIVKRYGAELAGGAQAVRGRQAQGSAFEEVVHRTQADADAVCDMAERPARDVAQPPNAVFEFVIEAVQRFGSLDRGRFST
jgi:hypothetical protein